MKYKQAWAATCFAPGDQGGTFNGNPLVAAVGHAVRRRIADAAFLHAVRARGLLINSPRPHLLRFMPAQNVSHAEIDTALSRLDQALGDVG